MELKCSCENKEEMEETKMEKEEVPVAEIVKPKVEDNPSTTDDELGKDNFDEMVKKYKSEIDNMKKNIEAAKEFKEMTEKMYELEKQVWKLHLEGDNIEKLNPDIKLQTVPEYWELQKKIVALDYEMKAKDREASIESHAQPIKKMNENIETIKKKLKEMGVEYE